MESILSKGQLEFWTLVKKINDCWRKRNPFKLADYFHKDVVFNSTDFKHQIKGKENCIQTYVDFMNISQVLYYFEGNPKVQLFNRTAIVTYEFEVKYKQNDRTFHEGGTDIIIFCRHQNFWKVIWRGLCNLKNLCEPKKLL